MKSDELWLKSGLHLRGNALPDVLNDGSLLLKRKELTQAIAGVFYLYVVDVWGKCWILDADTGAHHNMFVERDQSGFLEVYSSGELRIDDKGCVNVNCASGHFMMPDPLIYAHEKSAWRIAMNATIREAGFEPGNLSEHIAPVI